MGMLFNTHGTIDVRDTGLTAFNKTNMPTYRLNATVQANWTDTFTKLPNAGYYNPSGGTYNLVTGNILPNNIQPTIEVKAGNWKKWLLNFDKQNNSASRVAEVVATTVGRGISNAINNVGEDGAARNFSQVEFFIVPKNAANTAISATLSDIQDYKHDWSKIITIYTPIVDNLPHY